MAKRINQIQKFLNDKGIDALLIRSAAMKKWIDTLTGSGCTILITKKNGYLIADGRYTTEAMDKEHDLKLVSIVQKEPYIYTVKRLLEEEGFAKLGLEANETLASQYLLFKETGLDIILLDDEIAELRMIKDDQEIKLIQKAASLGDEIYSKVLDQIMVGMTEYEISALLQYYAISSGGEGMSFNTIVCSGPRTALPHGRPTNRQIGLHEPIMMDFGVQLNHYESDMTRICFLGEPDPAILKIYNVVKEAQQAGINAIRSGVAGHEVDEAARKIISDAGYGKYFVHGLGHGIGVDNSTEWPILNGKSVTILQENMVMSCEPGIYIPGIGGIRIEDMVQIKDGIGVPITHTTKDIVILKGEQHGVRL